MKSSLGIRNADTLRNTERTFAFGHDVVVNRVTQVDPVHAERGEPTDEGTVEDISECEWCPVVLWLPQTQKGEQGHQYAVEDFGIEVVKCKLYTT